MWSFGAVGAGVVRGNDRASVAERRVIFQVFESEIPRHAICVNSRLLKCELVRVSSIDCSCREGPRLRASGHWPLPAVDRCDFRWPR